MLMVHELPYLTNDVPGLGGVVKSQPSDFVVEEIPLYDASGEGTHVYFHIEKTSMTTMEAVHRVSRALGRRTYDIGYAGLKDSDAVTSQWFSLEHVDSDQVKELNLSRINVLSVSRHHNKIKLGHLSGNRFTIRIREVDVDRIVEVRLILETLSSQGVPNFFGPQRFGMRGDTWEIGRAVLRGDLNEALAVMLGRPGPFDYGPVRRARELYDQGDYQAAAGAWPYPFRNERRVCAALARSRGRPGPAFGAADKQVRRLYLSAYQSQLFNQVVARRVQSLDKVLAGDLAWIHGKGAVFLVEDAAREQPRCTAFEISPSGPLFGSRMSMPTGEPGEWESSLLTAEEMTADDWCVVGKQKVRGGRRPLRFQPHDVAADVGQDDTGPYIELRFFLESGCYATTLLREICKTTVEPAPATDDCAE